MCLAASPSVRATSMHHFEYCAPLVQTFWPVTTQLVAVLDRARLQRREVGAGVGLGEALAPDLLGRQDRGEEALLLLVGAPHHQRRAAEQQAEHVGGERDARAADLLEVDRRLGQRRAAAAVLGGPAGRGPARVVQRPLPVAPPRVAARPRRPRWARAAAGSRRASRAARRGRRSPSRRRSGPWVRQGTQVHAHGLPSAWTALRASCRTTLRRVADSARGERLTARRAGRPPP